MYTYICMYIYIYICIYMYMCVYVCIVLRCNFDIFCDCVFLHSVAGCDFTSWYMVYVCRCITQWITDMYVVSVTYHADP